MPASKGGINAEKYGAHGSSFNFNNKHVAASITVQSELPRNLFLEIIPLFTDAEHSLVQQRYESEAS